MNVAGSAEVEVCGRRVLLTPFRAAVLPESGVLAISDLHLGKAEAFRRAGSPIPSLVHDDDLAAVSALVALTGVKRLIVVGDLFHSRSTSDVREFRAWREQHPDLQIDLVRGNHDILPGSFFRDSRIAVFDHELTVPPFHFCHDPCRGSERMQDGSELFGVCGHLHPAVRLRGPGLHQEKLPCFWLRRTDLVLPAFGRFTGTSVIRPRPDQQVFVIAGDEVVQLR